MFKPSNTLLTSLFTALCLALPATGNAADTYVPRVEFGARLEPGNRIIHGAGQDAKGFSDYAKNFDGNHQPTIYMTYIGLTNPVDRIKSWGERLKLELAAHKSVKLVPQIGLNLTGGKDNGSGMDEDVSEGKFDARIVAFGDALTALDRPVFIRIGYEFEGKWNGYQPVAFQDEKVTDEISLRIRDAVMGKGIPVVDVLGVCGSPLAALVQVDDAALAGMAAGHLWELGFREFAYLGITPDNWALARLEAFAAWVGGPTAALAAACCSSC